ncbi:phosphoglycerate mutase [Acetobacter aceti 1023]|nr:phosphoglycerate mutase [Acetobacter aceti 1023]
MKQNRRIACYLSHSHAQGGIQSPALLLKGHYASYLAGIMIILRHCESEFNRHYNLHGGDPGLEDPHLSATGKAHAQELALKLADRGIRRILVSPFTRALQTATPLAQRLGITPQIMPLVRERGMYSCDKGTPASALAAAWPHLDFTHIEEHWWSPLPESSASLENRAQQFRQIMAQDTRASETLVVSHWWFLLSLTGESFENGDWQHFSP